MASFNAKTGTPHGQDLFVSSVNTIEVIGGGMVRVSFFVNENRDGCGLKPYPADWCLVIPASAVPDGIGKAIAATARMVIADTDGNITLVH